MMRSKGKRKSEESSNKELQGAKKSQSALQNNVLNQKLSSGISEKSCVKDMPKNLISGQINNTVLKKRDDVVLDANRTQKRFVKKRAQKKKLKTDSCNTPHVETCTKKKTCKAEDSYTCPMNSKKVQCDSSKQETQKTENQVPPVEKSECSKLHFARHPKPQARAQKVAELTSKKAEPTVTPANFSCNWKMLQQVLKKEKKKTNIHKRPNHGKGKMEPRVKQEQNITETNSRIWFDDIDDIFIESLKKKEDALQEKQEKKDSVNKSDNKLVKPGSFQGLTKVVAVDCEMVGVGEGGKESVLARVSIVNHFGQCVYDKYVKPQEPVTDYRTRVSGIRPENLKTGEDFSTVQKDVSRIFNGRLLVGHAIENDLKVLFLSHPRRMIRDTSTYKPFRKLCSGRKPALRNLAEKLLMVKVQDGEHNSVQDAQAAMRLYTMYRQDWEKAIKMNHKQQPQSSKKKKAKKTPAQQQKPGSN